MPDEIYKDSGFKYVLSIIDHFSKWLWSYPLQDKSGTSCLMCFKKYVYSFGFCKKLHTGNGREFKNSYFDKFCNDNNITHVFSKPYNPKSAGCIEASHKELKKIINDNFYLYKGENFDLENILIEAIFTHNNKIHSSTKYKPIDLKDIVDENIINNVLGNIKNKIDKAIKLKDLNLLEKNDYLLQ